MKKNYTQIILVGLFIMHFCQQGFAQSTNKGRLIFYNTENFFDTIKDPIKENAEFTPQGSSHWTAERYQHKLDNISKVIAAILDTVQPLLIGMSEIENIHVSEDLAAQPHLKKYNFGAIEFDSPDPRGIDVALLYNKALFTVTASESLKVILPDNIVGTRDILYVKGTVKGEELHIFINHWPSRREGSEKSRPKRFAAATVLHKKIAAIMAANNNARIITMGDFNDNPTDSSVINVLGAIVPTTAPYNAKQLYDLMAKPYTDAKFTLKYRTENDVFDQIIVSGNLLQKSMVMHVASTAGNIYNVKWLLYKHPKFGEIPNRTYSGPIYHGGFSDHLPVFIDLVW